MHLVYDNYNQSFSYYTHDPITTPAERNSYWSIKLLYSIIIISSLWDITPKDYTEGKACSKVCTLPTQWKTIVDKLML